MMSVRVVPWILDRFGVEESLIGDLVEQRQAGRSCAWLWRQFLVAMWSAVVRDLLAHPLRSTTATLLAIVLRYLAIRAWAVYAPSIDMAVGGALLDAVPLSRPALVVAVSWANAILLAPAWFGIGFVAARLSRGAVLLFLATALAMLLPGVARQLAHTIASNMVRWLLPVQLADFTASIGGFALSTLVGAACALRKGHEIA